MLAQVTTTVELKESGTLLNLLTDSQIANTQKIVIFGNELADNDFSVLKTMCVKNKLREIDIENTCGPMIPEKAFEACENLRQIKLPKYLQSIQKYAFQSCINLTDIEFPPSLKIVDIGAFRYCYSLSKLFLSRRLDKIESQAFLSCNGIKEIHCLGSVPPVCQYSSFSSSHYENTILFVPNGSKKSYSFSEGWLHFKNIKEEYVEKTCLLDLNIYNGANIFFVCPSLDFSEGWSSWEIMNNTHNILELEKGETVFIGPELWLNNYRIYVEFVYVNGKDMTSNLKGEFKDIFPFTIEKDTKIDFYMTKNAPVSNEVISNFDYGISTGIDCVIIDYPKEKGTISIYDLNGRLVCKRRIIAGVNYIPVSSGIYIIVLDEKKVKLKI